MPVRTRRQGREPTPSPPPEPSAAEPIDHTLTPTGLVLARLLIALYLAAAALVIGTGLYLAVGVPPYERILRV